MPIPATSTCQWSAERCRSSNSITDSAWLASPEANSSSSTRVAWGATREKFTPQEVTLAPRGAGLPIRIAGLGADKAPGT